MKRKIETEPLINNVYKVRSVDFTFVLGRYIVIALAVLIMWRLWDFPN
jgi:hypothetical protein